MPSSQYNYKLLAQYGKDVFINKKVEIRRPKLVTIGNHIAIDAGFYCTTALKMGDYIHIGPYVTVIGGANGLLKLGNFTTITAGCRIICVSDSFAGDGLVGTMVPKQFLNKLISKPVIFEDFSAIGTNTVVMPGVTLAEGTVVGACSFVNKSTKPWTIYYGIPAKPIRSRPKNKMIEFANKLGYYR